MKYAILLALFSFALSQSAARTDMGSAYSHAQWDLDTFSEGEDSLDGDDLETDGPTPELPNIARDSRGPSVRHHTPFRPALPLCLRL